MERICSCKTLSLPLAVLGLLMHARSPRHSEALSKGGRFCAGDETTEASFCRSRSVSDYIGSTYASPAYTQSTKSTQKKKSPRVRYDDRLPHLPLRRPRVLPSASGKAPTTVYDKAPTAGSEGTSAGEPKDACERTTLKCRPSQRPAKCTLEACGSNNATAPFEKNANKKEISSSVRRLPC